MDDWWKDFFGGLVVDFWKAAMTPEVTRAGTMESVYVITRGGRSETKRAVTRIYTTREILRMLSNAGFEGFETLGSLEGEPFRLGSPNLLVVARNR